MSPAVPLLLAALAGTATAQAPPPIGGPGSGWKAVRHDIEVIVVPETRAFLLEGELELELDRERSPGPTLGLNDEPPAVLEFTAVEAPEGGEVELVADDGARILPQLAHVRLFAPASRGDRLTLRYSAECRRSSNQVGVTPEGALASWVEVWYPVPVPAEVGSTSKATACVGRTRFHLPPGWRALSNGRHVSTEESEDGVVETWIVEVPVSRSFAAGPYEVHRLPVGEREVGVYLFSGGGHDVEHQARVLAQVLAAEEARLGPYPYASYGIAEVPARLGSFYASSEQGFIMVKPGALGWPDGNVALFGHELAHGWWGNLIGTDGPAGILLNESLAQYGSVIAVEALEGEDAATDFLRFSRPGYVSGQCARGYFGIRRAGRDKPLIELTSGGVDHQLSDAKGHWVYHMLRRRVGDEVFFGVLRQVIAERAGGEWSVAEMRRRFTEAAPEAGLERFFEQWLERAGAPVLEHEWKAAPGGVELLVRQVQAGEPYHLRLEVAVQRGDASELHEVELEGREQRFELACDGEPSGVALDPRHRLLIWTEAYGEKPQ